MKMVNHALSIGSVAGIPIRLHISLLIVIGLLAAFSGGGILGILLLVVGLFGSVALHELGHSLVARAKGAYIHEIVLYPIGGVARISNIPKRPVDEMAVALAGPAVSLALAIAFWLLGVLVPPFVYLGELNLMLFLFNLLPAFPMDGGRVFRAFLAIRKGRVAATRTAAEVGKYFCIFFVVYGLLRGHFLLAFIGFYIYRAGQMEYRMVLAEYRAQQPFAGGWGDVEVGPPPYADRGPNALSDRFRDLFRR